MNVKENEITEEKLVKEGQVIAGYRAEKLIGRGANSEVWLATKLSDNMQIALKVLSSSLEQNQEHLDIFQSEMNISSKLRHPGIVTAFDAGVRNNLCYLAMEYIDGVELAEKLLEEKVLSETESLEIVLNIAELLKSIWKNLKLVHRDIKPANIMIANTGATKLMDVGIAMCASSKQDESSNIAVGTPKFMSPEQAKNREIDFRTDIYALGVTLYIMLTGQPPYDDIDPLTLIKKKLTEDLPNPKDIKSDLSDGICELLTIMLAKKKENRQESWNDVINDVKRVSRGHKPISKLSEEEKQAMYAKKSQLHLEHLKNIPADKKYIKKNDNSFSIKQILIAVGIVIFLLVGLLYYMQDKLN